MKHKVSDLEGALLDAAVAKALGHMFTVSHDGMVTVFDWQRAGSLVRGNPFEPSIAWAHGGPIIERERITVGPRASTAGWTAACDPEFHSGESFGPTPLIAAMRAFVASKLGEDVELP
jgi:hypothetical protein